MPQLAKLDDLFLKELRDIFDAEKQITKAIPKMVRAAESDELRAAFEEHLEVTREQIQRLEQVFEMLDTRAKGAHCPGMEGIIKEGSELLQQEGDPSVMDAGLIAAAQKVEHYEIATYGTLVTYAKMLGHEDAADLLSQTLEEEKETDQRLTQLAENFVNPSAASGKEDEEEEEEQVRPQKRRRARARA